jgi:serine/threonine protein kinase
MIDAERQGTLTTGGRLQSCLYGSYTPLYASPQQMRGDEPDPRDDVFSLGVIWYQMLTGNLSAARPGGEQWKKKLLDQGLSAKMIELMVRCFEDERDDRPADASVLADRIAALLTTAEVPKKGSDVAPPDNLEEALIKGLPDGPKRVYLELRQRAKSFGPDVESYGNRASQLVFKAGKNFAEFNYKKRKQLFICLVRPEGFSIPENRSSEVRGLTVTRKPDKYGWALNHEFQVAPDSDINAIMDLIRQSYDAVRRK